MTHWLLCRLFHSFFVRLRTESTASGYKRYLDDTVEWILSVKSQVGMRATEKFPSIKEYVLFRRVTVAMKVSRVFFIFYFFILVIPLVQGSNAKSQKFKIKNKAQPYDD